MTYICINGVHHYLLPVSVPRDYDMHTCDEPFTYGRLASYYCIPDQNDQKLIEPYILRYAIRIHYTMHMYAP
jgi:hypothetical protein